MIHDADLMEIIIMNDFNRQKNTISSLAISGVRILKFGVFTFYFVSWKTEQIIKCIELGEKQILKIFSKQQSYSPWARLLRIPHPSINNIKQYFRSLTLFLSDMCLHSIFDSFCGLSQTSIWRRLFFV